MHFECLPCLEWLIVCCPRLRCGRISDMALRRVKATFDYLATEAGELSIKKGDIIVVLEVRVRDDQRRNALTFSHPQEDSTGWWKGDLKGVVGFFPSNFSEPYEEQPTDAGWAQRRVRWAITSALASTG